MNNRIKIYNCPEDCQKVDVLTTEINHLRDEVKELKEDNHTLGMLTKDLEEYLDDLTARYKTMTARCKAAEELLDECRACDRQSPISCGTCKYWNKWLTLKNKEKE